jgi:hypothetical protein
MIPQKILEACVVKLSEVGGKGRTGSGFFVAPGHILTCAHVVESDTGQQCPFRVEGDFGTTEAMPERLRPDGLADLAILQISTKDHPIVLLGGVAEIGDPVWTIGFVTRQNELRIEPSAGEIEGERRARLETGGPEYTLIKFKGGQIVPGMSGSPLLNRRTGQVCGAVARTLNEQSNTGGLAVPFRIILACYPEISVHQSEYHKKNPDWRALNLTLPSAELTDAQIAEILLSFPEGPGVFVGDVPSDIISAFYTLDSGSSSVTVQLANNLRLRSRRGGVKPYALTLSLGNPALMSSVDYWQEVFARAAPKGPRMLAALLYASPPGTLDGLDQTLSEFLGKLRTWPVA